MDDHGQRFQTIIEAFFVAHPERSTRRIDGELYVRPEDCHAAVWWARERGMLTRLEAMYLATTLRRMENAFATQHPDYPQDTP